MPADRSLDKLHPELRAKWEALRSRAAAAGHPVFLTEGFREPAYQRELYAQGRTRPGRRVTDALPEQSLHCDTLPDGTPCARAFDVAFRVPRGRDIYAGPWDLIGELGEACGLKWGGRWRGDDVDRPHFYIPRERS